MKARVAGIAGSVIALTVIGGFAAASTFQSVPVRPSVEFVQPAAVETVVPTVAPTTVAPTTAAPAPVESTQAPVVVATSAPEVIVPKVVEPAPAPEVPAPAVYAGKPNPNHSDPPVPGAGSVWGLETPSPTAGK